jgi:hypothetical protein
MLRQMWKSIRIRAESSGYGRKLRAKSSQLSSLAGGRLAARFVRAGKPFASR